MLIFVPKLTNRIGYTLNVVFNYLLQIDYTITTNVDFYRACTTCKLCYGDSKLDDSPFLRANDLLFSSAIEDPNPRPFQHEGLTVLFPTYDNNSVLPFDLFAATFYLVSRYEEYLPHHIDAFGRFPANESVSALHHFLDTPVVDHWALLLHRTLQERYPELPAHRRRYTFEATIDIDAAYSYRNKGILRTIAGVTRDFSKPNHRELLKERWQVLRGKRQDPFDTFDYLLEKQRQYPNLKMLFFPLLADYGQYDKPIAYTNNEFRDLIQHLGDYTKMGIHASFQSSENAKLIHTETQRLADILHRPIIRNRYHYLRLQLPQSYRHLAHEGIVHDYTMGYSECTGYRAGTATPYPFYDLERDEESPLIIHPFSVMDTTLIRHQQRTPEQAYDIYKHHIDQARAVGSSFSAIWHNQNLCDTPEWIAWRKLFEQVLVYGNSNNTL